MTIILAKLTDLNSYQMTIRNIIKKMMFSFKVSHAQCTGLYVRIITIIRYTYCIYI